MKILWKIFNIIGRPFVKRWSFVVFVTLAFWLTTSKIHLPARSTFTTYSLELWLDLYVIAAFLCLLDRWFPKTEKVVRVAIYIVMYAVCMTECFLHARFQMTYSPTMFQLIGETNGGETGEFLALCLKSPQFWQNLWPWVCLIALQVACAFVHLKLRIENKYWKLFVGYTSLVAVVALFLFQNPRWWQDRMAMNRYFILAQSGQAERTNSRIYFTSAYRLAYSLKFWSLTRHEVDCLVENMQALQVDSCDYAVPTIVLVIGESYNKHHASVYGYNRRTTSNMERMKRQGSLVVFDDVVTPWNVTSQVFRWMFSTHSIDEQGIWADGVLWPALFKKAGYRVAFVTNQYNDTGTRQNKIDFSGSFFLNTPELDSLCFDYRNKRRYQYDGKLLAELDSLETQYPSSPYKLDIIHLVGQHMDARLRTPDNRCFWTKENYIHREDLNEKERTTLANYDNATRYNDQVFARICQRYKKENAIVVYIADHGEEVYEDGGVHMYGRNHKSLPNAAILRAEYEVPMVMWLSPMLRRRNPALVRRVKAASRQPFMIDDICHVMMGIAGIHTPYYVASRDLLSSEYNAHRCRKVKRTTDYDKVINNAEKCK